MFAASKPPAGQGRGRFRACVWRGGHSRLCLYVGPRPPQSPTARRLRRTRPIAATTRPGRAHANTVPMTAATRSPFRADGARQRQFPRHWPRRAGTNVAVRLSYVPDLQAVSGLCVRCLGKLQIASAKRFHLLQLAAFITELPEVPAIRLRIRAIFRRADHLLTRHAGSRR